MEEKIKEQVRQEVLEEIKRQDTNITPYKQNDLEKNSKNTASQIIENKKQELLNSEEANELSQKLAQEDIKADMASHASNIHKKNVDNAEHELENKKRERQLEREDAELELLHQYKMESITRDNEHRKMLDSRRKMVEKYGYLYDNKETISAIDGDNQKYDLPKDFSFSVPINKIRQFGRNISKLDKPLLQTIKWGFIIGGIVLGVFVLKWTGLIG